MLGSLKCEYPGLSPDVINSILDGIQASIRQKVKGQCNECLGLSSNVINSIVDGIQASIRQKLQGYHHEYPCLSLDRYSKFHPGLQASPEIFKGKVSRETSVPD